MKKADYICTRGYIRITVWHHGESKTRNYTWSELSARNIIRAASAITFRSRSDLPKIEPFIIARRVRYRGLLKNVTPRWMAECVPNLSTIKTDRNNKIDSAVKVARHGHAARYFQRATRNSSHGVLLYSLRLSSTGKPFASLIARTRYSSYLSRDIWRSSGKRPP